MSDSPSLGRMVRLSAPAIWWWLLFALWATFFFPFWYRLSYTKLRELRALARVSGSEQLSVLYAPGDLAQLERIRTVSDRMADGNLENLAVVVPDDTEAVVHPLVHNRAILRAFLDPRIPIRTLQTVQDRDTLILLLSVESETERLQAALEQGGQGSPRRVIPLEVEL